MPQVFKPNPIIFSVQSYNYLANDICNVSGFEQGKLETRTFPDGERYLRFVTDVRDRDVVLIGGTIDNNSTLDLFDMGCGLVAAGCQHLTLVVPFYGYSTMERSTQAGEVVTAKTRAKLISTIPLAPIGNQIVLLDLHAEGIAYYFEGAIIPVHLNAKPLIIQAARRLAGERDFVIACVDAGRAKWVQRLANDLGVRAAFVFKRRISGKETEVSAVSAAVNGQDVIIYDDMIRTGNSILKAAKAYKDAGARNISVIATHGLFCGDALSKLRESGLISQIECTDSHPAALGQKSEFLKVMPTAELFSKFLQGGTVETH